MWILILSILCVGCMSGKFTTVSAQTGGVEGGAREGSFLNRSKLCFDFYSFSAWLHSVSTTTEEEHILQD